MSCLWNCTKFEGMFNFVSSLLFFIVCHIADWSPLPIVCHYSSPKSCRGIFCLSVQRHQFLLPSTLSVSPFNWKILHWFIDCGESNPRFRALFDCVLVYFICIAASTIISLFLYSSLWLSKKLHTSSLCLKTLILWPLTSMLSVSPFNWKNLHWLVDCGESDPTVYWCILFVLLPLPYFPYFLLHFQSSVWKTRISHKNCFCHWRIFVL